MSYFKGRWDEMSRGRRIILLIHPVLFILSLILSLTLGQQQVVSYRNGHLRYERQRDAAVYSGRAEGYQVKYVVSPGPVVEFWLDGSLDSTYTVTEDPTAIPETNEAAALGGPENLTGIEIRKGDEVWFRGGLSNLLFLLLAAGRKRERRFLRLHRDRRRLRPGPRPGPHPTKRPQLRPGPGNLRPGTP